MNIAVSLRQLLFRDLQILLFAFIRLSQTLVIRCRNIWCIVADDSLDILILCLLFQVLEFQLPEESLNGGRVCIRNTDSTPRTMLTSCATTSAVTLAGSTKLDFSAMDIGKFRMAPSDDIRASKRDLELTTCRSDVSRDDCRFRAASIMAAGSVSGWGMMRVRGRDKTRESPRWRSGWWSHGTVCLMSASANDCLSTCQCRGYRCTVTTMWTQPERPNR